MARVEWTRLSGDEVEHVVSVLLCREFPNAQRIRPSAGDGGIDVRVPLDDGIAIYQVKKFASNLASSEKTQIRKSFERLLTHSEETGLPVREWHLTMPLDPTKENLEWLHELTSDADFQCHWDGLIFVESLTAKYPDVIDYYLRDGRDRLTKAMQDLATAMSLYQTATQDVATTPLSPAEAQAGLLAAYHLLNNVDPHYRYDIRLEETPGAIEATDDLVFASTSGTDKGSITYLVYSRFGEALEERPVSFRVQIPVEPGSDTERGLKQFQKFGIPFTSVPGSAKFSADLPGGLGGTFENGTVKIGLAGPSGSYRLRMQVVRPDGSVAAEGRLLMEGPFTGPTRRGARAHGREEGGCFAIEILTDLEAETVKLNLSASEIEGRPIVDIINGVRLLREISSPNRIRFAALAGPVRFDPLPAVEFAPYPPAVYRLVEALAVIQEHTTIQVVMPIEDELTPSYVGEVHRAARLLQGEEVKVMVDSATIGMERIDAELPEGPTMLTTVTPLKLRLGAEEANLGDVQVLVPSAKLSVAPGVNGDGELLSVSPSSGSTFEMKMKLVN